MPRLNPHPAAVFALALLSLATAPGCAPAARPEPAPAAHRAHLAHVERLYFGRNMGDTAVVSDSAWGAFVREVLTVRFPDGLTIWDAAGQWRSPDGATVHERTFVVELVHLVGSEAEDRVQAVIDEYKRRFAQQAVMRVVTEARATF